MLTADVVRTPIGAISVLSCWHARDPLYGNVECGGSPRHLGKPGHRALDALTGLPREHCILVNGALRS